MKSKKLIIAVIFHCCILHCQDVKAQHDIVFCGERIPVDNDFVAGTLMNIIRRQIPNVNLPELRRRAALNFPMVERYLEGTGMPEDLKYIAIVESGFLNQNSPVGARGFWQFMPATARDLGLTVSADVDDRDNIYKSTYAACKLLASYYVQIRNKYKISSWILTAAAYNTGIGNMLKKINTQGNDYFSMNLNPETAMYVYKIIAVKELFEYPELYMKDFGYNVFSTVQPPASGNMQNSNYDSSLFKSMTVNINTGDGEHPDSVSTAGSTAESPAVIKPKINTGQKQNVIYVAASIEGKYKNFSDGQLISIKLLDDLNVNGIFNSKGNVIKGTGWLIDNRILIDLGYEDHAVTLINDGKKGVDAAKLKNNQPVLLKVLVDDNL